MAAILFNLPCLLVGLFLFGMGCMAIFDPSHIGGYFGLHEPGADMRNEIRAVYGGFGIFSGLLLLTTFRPGLWRAAIELSFGLALLGMASGRIASYLIDGLTDFYPYFYMCVEIIAGGGLLLDSLRLRKNYV